jgi:hypothetical protein
MVTISPSLRKLMDRFFTRRTAFQEKTSMQRNTIDKSASPQVIDAITMESIVSIRGQNPFPEEEGEMRYMTSTMREQSLHSR